MKEQLRVFTFCIQRGIVAGRWIPGGLHSNFFELCSKAKEVKQYNPRVKVDCSV